MPIVFLLVNINPAVRKIFNITAKKAGIRLDVVNSISQIPLNENYNCIFVDDGVLDTGNIEQFKSKFVNTKFCLIVSKDTLPSNVFDAYIRKPFLPIDIYEVLKKEKSDKNPQSTPSQPNNTVKSAKEFVAYNNSNIDLSEFSDSEDEFLSGVKDSAPNDFVDLDIKEGSQDIDIPLAAEVAHSGSARIGKVETIKVSEEKAPIENDNSIDIAEAQAIDLAVLSNNNSNDTISGSDDIDFSSIFKLQNEFLQEEARNKKGGLIGGDGYKKKELRPTKPEPEVSNANINTKPNDIAVKGQDSTKLINEKVEQNIIANDNKDDENIDLDWFDNTSLDDIKEEQLKQNSFSIDNAMQTENEISLNNEGLNAQEEQYNTFDLPIDDSGNIKDINELSEDELENLDDEALLLLQEQSLNDHNENDTTKNSQEPKVLNKQDINEITSILNSTNDVATQSNNFSYFAQDVNLADEENVESNSLGDDIKYEFDNTQEYKLEESVEQVEQPVFSQPQVQEPLNQGQQSTQINPSNVNIDLTDIIKTFPIDKLRELLSGVQITINITFPTKK